MTLSNSPHVTQNSRVIASSSVFVSSHLITCNFFFNCIPATQPTQARVTRPINSVACAARSIYGSGYMRLMHHFNLNGFDLTRTWPDFLAPFLRSRVSGVLLQNPPT